MTVAKFRGRVSRLAFNLIVAANLLECAACGLMPDRELIVSADQDGATVRGYETARAWADGPLEPFAASIRSPNLVASAGHDVNYLALSAGGAGGAFAAGLLNGWTAEGGRPQFDMVSGVSSGALIAPFAFLGSDYDGLLDELYTKGGTDGLDSLLGPVGVLRTGGLVDSAPLRRLVERYANDDLLARIAAEHRRGRRLLVVTTNLDAQRPVVWNLGAIAASGRPDALKMFRDVLIASASVPGVYQPVLIEAHGRDRSFKEMHVDGATTAEVFIAQSLLDGGLKRPRANRGKVHIWVLVNNTLTPEYGVTSIGPLSIAGRSLSTLAKAQTIWIIKAAQQEAEATGTDFNVAQIDRQVAYDGTRPFQLDYMRTVYGVGYKGAVARTVWMKGMAPFRQSALQMTKTGN